MPVAGLWAAGAFGARALVLSSAQELELTLTPAGDRWVPWAPQAAV